MRARFPFRFIAPLVFTAVAGWLPSTQAQVVAQAVVNFDTLVRNYNVITFGNTTLGSGYGDTHGPLAVQGTLTVNGGSIAQGGNFPVTSDPTLYVSGGIVATGTVQVAAGYAAIPSGTAGTWNSTQKSLTLSNGGVLSSINSSATNAANDPRTNSAPSNWSWSSIQSSATSISNSLANATATGTVSVVGQTLTFSSGGATGVTVFNFNAALLSGNTYNGQMFSSVAFDGLSTGVFAVNVNNLANGQTLFGNGVNFNFANGYEHLLWNLIPSGGAGSTASLGNGGQFYGSVLAPLVNLSNANNTAVNGQVVAASYTHSGAEIHYTGFDASGISFSAVPEPSTYAIAAVGLCVAGAVWHRRRTVNSSAKSARK